MRTQLGRLRRNGPFVEFLRQTGQQTNFDQAAHRVLDRSSGTQLQNLRGLDLPYQFLEIPFPPHAPIRNAQVHIFGEGRGRQQKYDPQNTAVAIDLTTTRLGDLWISLAIHQGVCRCWIRARTSEVVRAVETHASDLADRLSGLGYPGTRVRASLWNGDRLSEVVSLVAQFKEVDFQA